MSSGVYPTIAETVGSMGCLVCLSHAKSGWFEGFRDVYPSTCSVGLIDYLIHPSILNLAC